MSTDRLIFDCVFFDVSGRTILQGAYLELTPGEVCGLFGLNGSGKTTLFRVGTGELKPRSGHFVLDGFRFIKRQTRTRFAKLAYLPQKSMLPRRMSVEGVVKAFPDSATSILSDDVLRDRARRKIQQLSGGERRYLELLLVLSLGRKYVILDEPFLGLEPVLIEKSKARLRQASTDGAGILITDQYRQHMLPFVDRAYLMQNKQIQLLGEASQVEDELIARGYIRHAEIEQYRSESKN